MNIICNSTSGTGKDAFMRCCSEFISTRVVSTVDCVKIMLQREGLYQGELTKLGWINEVKYKDNRELMSRVKQAIMDYNEYPLTRTMELVSACQENLVFIVVREFDQFLKLRDMCNAKTLTILRPSVNRIDLEQGFFDEVPYGFKYDFYVDNSRDLNCLRKTALAPSAKSTAPIGVRR